MDLATFSESDLGPLTPLFCIAMLLFGNAFALDFTEFVLRDCIEGEIMSACDELDLKLLEGEASDPDLDFKELKSRFVISKDFDFSCEIALQSDYKKVADAEDAASAAIDMVADSSEEKSEDESAKTATV